MLKPRRTSYTFRILPFAFLLLFPIFGVGQNRRNDDERKRGIELYQQQQYVAASDVLTKVVLDNKEDDLAWSYLGLALLRQEKRTKDASKALETALKLKPESVMARVGLAYGFLLRDKLSEAVREAQKALSIDPKSVEAHYIVGMASLRKGAREDALHEAETSITLDPNFAPAYLLKSQVFAGFAALNVPVGKDQEPDDDQKSRYARGAEALENYLRLNPAAEGKLFWTDQLESLRFHASPRTELIKEGVFRGKEVTTRARVQSQPPPQYPDSARGRATGIVVLRAVLAADGTVKHILVVKGLPYGLTESSVAAARKIKFTPAKIDGRPVSMFVQIEYDFSSY